METNWEIKTAPAALLPFSFSIENGAARNTIAQAK